MKNVVKNSSIPNANSKFERDLVGFDLDSSIRLSRLAGVFI